VAAAPASFARAPAAAGRIGQHGQVRYAAWPGQVPGCRHRARTIQHHVDGGVHPRQVGFRGVLGADGQQQPLHALIGARQLPGNRHGAGARFSRSSGCIAQALAQVQDVAGDKPRRVADQERDNLCDLLGARDVHERGAGSHGCADLIADPSGVGDWRLYRVRRDAE